MVELYILSSLDPRGWIDIYPKWVCEEFTETFKQYQETGTPERLVLGQRFFGVTIHFKNEDNSPNIHYQTTTNGGYRSVASEIFRGQSDVTMNMSHTDYSIGGGGGWRFVTGVERSGTQSVTAKISDEFFNENTEVKKVAIWQWARLTGEQLFNKKQDGTYDRSVTLKRLPDSDWVTYPLETSDRIEKAWQENEANCQVEVGLRQYNIEFDHDRVFAKQRDIRDDTRVRCVRRNPNLTISEITESLRKWEEVNTQVDGGEACPLCYDSFNAQYPMVTLSCTHKFHCSCMQPMLINNLKNHYGDVDSLEHHCPMCRDRFTSQKYTELTGDEIKITNYTYDDGGR